jgi:hypothetical protein
MSEPGPGTPHRRPRAHGAWALAVAALAIVAIAGAGFLYILRSARSLPEDVVEGGRQALLDLAAAFRTGTVTTTFRSDATRIHGTTRLQFVELRQLETFERRDAESILWGTLALPDVVVEARAPVVYEYFVDFDKPWRFRLEGRDVLVVAPPIEWNPPSVDVSALRYEVREGSVLRNEQIVADRLRRELTGLVAMRARQHVPLVRETGRRKVEAFVETWLVQRFGDGKDYRARVRFADEPGATPTASPAVPALATPQG